MITQADIHEQAEKLKPSYDTLQYYTDKGIVETFNRAEWNSLSQSQQLELKVKEAMIAWYKSGYDYTASKEAEEEIKAKGYTHKKYIQDDKLFKEMDKDRSILTPEQKIIFNKARLRKVLYESRKSNEAIRAKLADDARKEREKRIEEENKERERKSKIKEENDLINKFNAEQKRKNDLFNATVKQFIVSVSEDEKISDYEDEIKSISCTNPEFVRGYLSAISDLKNGTIGDLYPNKIKRLKSV